MTSNSAPTCRTTLPSCLSKISAATSLLMKSKTTMLSPSRFSSSGRPIVGEVVADRRLHLRLHDRVGHPALDGLRPLPLSGSSTMIPRFDVKIDDALGEVHGDALPVGEPAVLEDLQELVEHLRVGLLDLVEQDHLERLRRTALVSSPPAS